MNQPCSVTMKDSRDGTTMAVPLLVVAVLSLVLPSPSPAEAVGGATLDVSLSSTTVGSLTVTEEELLPRFPEVEGANLEKRDFRLPDDFEGEANLIFIAFRRPHQAEVESWLPLAKELVEGHPGLRFYELPTISVRGAMARRFINQGMRRGIPDPKAREVTITLYLEKEPFRQALDIPDEESIHVLLVGREGRIHWRAQGALTASSAAGLERAVARRLEAAARQARYEFADFALGIPGGFE